MILAARGVTVARGRVLALADVSVSVASGQALGVFGPSGAGKSTLLGALAGQIPSRGDVSLQGHDVTREPVERRVRRGLGYVPQGPSVLFDLSAEDNLATVLRVARRQGDPRASLEEVGLLGRADVAARDLSGGERRRLELARALSLSPAILLCDEPFAGLGPRDLELVRGVLARRVREGLALLITDHRVAEALALCDRALLLVDGRVIVERSRDEFLAAPEVCDRYLSGVGGDPPRTDVRA